MGKNQTENVYYPHYTENVFCVKRAATIDIVTVFYYTKRLVNVFYLNLSIKLRKSYAN
jgi:hypothetical protein